jgi:signal transduction histidine kinase
LLAFIRLDQGQVTLNRESLDLQVVLAPAVEGQRARAAERKVTVALDLPPDLPMAFADSQELALALNHLLDNAVKFTPAGGSVAVRGAAVTDAGGRPAVEITVQDTGIGIPPEEQQKVFERFYQIDSSMTRQYGGVGIGLAVVKQVVEAHGSTIRLESEPGKGSTFRFTLPVAA